MGIIKKETVASYHRVDLKLCSTADIASEVTPVSILTYSPSALFDDINTNLEVIFDKAACTWDKSCKPNE